MTHLPRRHRRPRLGEFDYTGHYAYHLVTVTQRRTHALTGEFGRLVVRHLESSAAAHCFELLCYTVMPDHVHILARGLTDDASAIRFMQRFKQTTGRAYAEATGDRLWQQSFFDHVLRRDDDALTLARYVHENPERAGLTDPESEWPLRGGTMVAGDG